MRSTTAGELAVLADVTRRITWRVKVANGSGTMIDLSSWVERITISQDIDDPVSSATIEFTRADSGTNSLSPLRTDSKLNVLDDGITYAPLLDLGRSITIELATTAIGAPVNNSDIKPLFQGKIDVVNIEKSPVSVECRDQGGQLVDRWIETPKNYGTAPGRALELVIQDILDDTFGAGVVPLYVPTSPSFLVTIYQQQVQSVMDALQALAFLVGWDIRYKWDDGTSAFRLTLSQPPRTKTVPDYTFGPSQYFDIRALNLDITNIRNAIRVSYRDKALGARSAQTVTDSTSIAKYGRRFFHNQEGDTSPIDTSTKALGEGSAMLSDLKEPKAVQEVDAPFCWPADLGDLYRFLTNSVHYNSSQDLAVTKIEHELMPDSHQTTFGVRGNPAGAYLNWFSRGTAGPGSVGPFVPPGVARPSPSIRHVNTETDNTDWDLEFDCLPGAGGGGANLTYELWKKIGFGAPINEGSGNGLAFPFGDTITRDLQFDTDLWMTVLDNATGIEVEVHLNIPSQRAEIDSLGQIVRTRLFNDGKYALQATESNGTTKSSTAFAPQGSVLPAPSERNAFSYNSGGPATGKMWLAWTWTGFQIGTPAGGTINVPASSTLPAPPSPTVSQVAGGPAGARTLFVRIGYVKNLMIYRVGSETSIAVLAGNALKVTSPPAIAGYDGWVPLVGTAANGEFIQVSLPFGSDFTESVSGFNSTTTTPYDNTFMPSGVTAQALNASQPYNFYEWYDIDLNIVAFASRGSIGPSMADAQAQNRDGRIALQFGPMVGSTPAAGLPGSGSSIGGGKFA